MKLGRIEGNGGTDTLLPTVKWNCVDHKPQKRGTQLQGTRFSRVLSIITYPKQGYN